MKNYFICIFIITSPLGFSLHNKDSHLDHKEKYEIGISLETFTIKEDHGTETAPGTHFHIIRNYTHNGFLKKFGLGISGEVIFAEEEHYGVMASIAFYPWDDVAIILSPGYSFAKHEGETENMFSMHYELNYAFEYDNIHMGPVVSYSATKEGEHYSFGWHFGF